VAIEGTAPQEARVDGISTRQHWLQDLLRYASTVRRAGGFRCGERGGVGKSFLKGRSRLSRLTVNRDVPPTCPSARRKIVRSERDIIAGLARLPVRTRLVEDRRFAPPEDKVHVRSDFTGSENSCLAVNPLWEGRADGPVR